MPDERGDLVHAQVHLSKECADEAIAALRREWGRTNLVCRRYQRTVHAGRQAFTVWPVVVRKKLERE